MNDIKCNGRKWVQIRKDILKFFHYTCQRCKISFTEKEVFVPFHKRPLEIHHIEPKYYGGQDIFLNFTVLCMKCHRKETRRIIQENNRIRHFNRKNTKNQRVLI